MITIWLVSYKRELVCIIPYECSTASIGETLNKLDPGWIFDTQVHSFIPEIDDSKRIVADIID